MIKRIDINNLNVILDAKPAGVCVIDSENFLGKIKLLSKPIITQTFFF
jgi:hypothetical protein